VTQEAEIRRMEVQSQPRQIVHKTLSQNNSPQKKKKKWGTGRVAQDVGPKFKPQYHKKKKKRQPCATIS
jgi:hypothetical protein